MLRTSMLNFMRMTVLFVVVLVAGGIGSAAVSELLPNSSEAWRLLKGSGF